MHLFLITLIAYFTFLVFGLQSEVIRYTLGYCGSFIVTVILLLLISEWRRK